MGSKPVICKCGHDGNLHKGKSKLSAKTYCRECPCSSYMNRNTPFKSDYAITIFSVGFTAFVIILSYVFIIESNPTLTGIENQPINMTNGQMYEIFIILIFSGNVLFIAWFAIDPILGILEARKRKEFPIDEKNGKL